MEYYRCTHNIYKKNRRSPLVRILSSQTPSISLSHPSTTHCHNWLHHRSLKNVIRQVFCFVLYCCWCSNGSKFVTKQTDQITTGHVSLISVWSPWTLHSSKTITICIRHTNLCPPLLFHSLNIVTQRYPRKYLLRPALLQKHWSCFGWCGH